MEKLTPKTNIVIVISLVVVVGALVVFSESKIFAQPATQTTPTQTFVLPKLADLGAPDNLLTSFKDFQSKLGTQAPVQPNVQAVQLSGEVLPPSPAPETGTTSVQVSPNTKRKIVRLDGSADYAFYCDLIGGKDSYTGDQGTSNVFFSLSDNIRSMMADACTHN